MLRIASSKKVSHNLSLVIAVTILLSVYSTSIGQTPFFQSYPLLKKNEAVLINTIYQDRKGFMWIGSSKGLFRYDGINKIGYGKEQNLLNENITAIAEDSLGRIWVGDTEGRLSFLEKNKFTAFAPDEGAASQTISDILFDTHGHLWFSTFNDGLYYYTNNRLYRVDEQEGMPDLYVYDLAEDPYGNIWAGTDGGIAICTLKDKAISINVINYDDGLPDNIVKKIIPEDKIVWLATEDAGIIRFNVAAGTFEALVKQPWSYGMIEDFIIKGDKLWLSCPQKGLVILDRKTNESTVYSTETLQGLSSIKVLEKDNEGNIWAGTKAGLLRTPGDDLQFLENPATTGSTNVIAVTVDFDMNIWFSTEDGLFKRSSGDQTGSTIKNMLANTLYKDYEVISLYTDHEGYIWAGLYGEGVLRINPDYGTLRYFNKELSNGNILNISGDLNKVWLATLGGCTQITITGIDQFQIKNCTRAEGLISDFNYQVFGEKDKTWFATDGKGLGMLDKTGYHQFDKGLPSKVIYNIARDASQTLWVNVQGNGIYRFDGEAFHPLDSSLQLRDNNIHILTTDKNGNLIAFHDLGMEVIDIRNKHIRYLGEEAGLLNKIANLNAFGRDTLGNIYMGVKGGVIKYSRETMYLNTAPVPEIETVKIFDEAVDHTALTNLSYNENNITINYLGLWYQNPTGLLFSYRLENYDRDWIQTTDNSVTYSRLPAGEYVFRVKVSETEDFSRARESTISFSISPPFWQTNSFYVGIVALVLLTGYSFIKFRERALRRDNELLEATVKQRTLEIQKQKDEIALQHQAISVQAEEIKSINENLENIVQQRTAELKRKNKVLEDYAFLNAHKLRSPVATILGLINLFEKTKLDHEGTEIHNYLKATANDLDQVVCSISRTIEKGDKLIPDELTSSKEEDSN